MDKNGGYLKSLNILNLALVVGIALFAGMSYFFINSGEFANNVLDLGQVRPYIYVIAAVFLFLGMNVGTGFYRTKMAAIPANAPFEEKLKLYRTAFIVRAFMVEIPTILIIVFAMLLSNINLLILAPFAIVILLFRRASYERVVVDMNLNKEEQQLLLQQ